MKCHGNKWSILIAAAFFLSISILPVTAAHAAPDNVRLIVAFTAAQDYFPRELRAVPGLRRVRRLHAIDAAWRDPAEVTTRHAATKWYAVEVTPDYATSLEAKLRANPLVASVTTAAQYEAAFVPNDPRFIDQYALESTSTPLADIDAPAAWDVTTGSSQTVIAIIDGGFDVEHEDLHSNVWHNSDEIAGNGQDDDGNGYIDDTTGWDFVRNQPLTQFSDHATHVAGIAAASGNNSVGIAGINWQARLMNVRVLGSNNLGSEDDIIAGMYYAVANGAKIINMSIVGSQSTAMRAAVDYAYAHGVVVVAAAGNGGRNANQYPACAETVGAERVIGVGATDEDGEPASFSNYGSCLNVAAPGKNIFSTRRGNAYGLMTGTSMSAPLVAGVAGLYHALHPESSVDAIIAAVSRGVAFTGSKAEVWNVNYKGRLNAALVVGGTVSVPVPSTAPTPSSSPLPPSPTLPTPTPTILPPAVTNTETSGGGDGGGGGGDGASEPEPAPTPQPKPRVAGTISARANLALLPRVKDTFFYVYGRLPTLTEKTYWGLRVKRAEKRTYPALLGAMQWQRIHLKPPLQK